MRNYILSPHERKLAERFLEEGVRLDGFNVLKLRMIKNLPSLKHEIELIKNVVNKTK